MYFQIFLKNIFFLANSPKICFPLHFFLSNVFSVDYRLFYSTHLNTANPDDEGKKRLKIYPSQRKKKIHGEVQHNIRIQENQKTGVEGFSFESWEPGKLVSQIVQPCPSDLPVVNYLYLFDVWWIPVTMIPDHILVNIKNNPSITWNRTMHKTFLEEVKFLYCFCITLFLAI